MRPRTKDKDLPPCVYRKHGAYYLVKNKKWIRLGTDQFTALIEYARQVAVPTEGMPQLIDRAMPHLLKDVAKSTAKQYAHSAKLLREVFRDFSPDRVRHGDIVQMMDGFADRPAIANRMLTVLRMTYRWALDRGVVETDPTISVKRFTLAPRDRLITPGEFAAIYKLCAPWLQCVLDLCYMTGQRIGDVLSIERSQLQVDGIYFQQQKTGQRLIVEWTPALRDVVAQANRVNPVVSARYLLAGRAGKLRAHTNVWRSFKNAAEKAGVKNATLHDLRAMAGTEIDRQGGDATALLGHKSRRTTDVYLRDKSPRIVTGLDSSPAKKTG